MHAFVGPCRPGPANFVKIVIIAVCNASDPVNGFFKHVFDTKLARIALQSTESGAVIADHQSNFDFAHPGAISGDCLRVFIWNAVGCCRADAGTSRRSRSTYH